MASNKATLSHSESEEIMESPRSTVRVAPIDKDRDKEKGSDPDSSKFKEDLRTMFQEFEDRIAEKIQALDAKFTNILQRIAERDGKSQTGCYSNKRTNEDSD